MNRLGLIFLSIALGSGVALRAQNPADHAPINLKTDMVYKTTAEGDLHLDLFYPAADLVGAYPLVVYTHGGGWAAGSKNKARGRSSIARTVRGLTEAGFCVAAVEYRLCNQGDTRIRDCVTDAMDAVRYLAKHGKELHLDSTRVFTFGDSAGGQLAQMLLLTAADDFLGAAELAGQRYTMLAGVSWYGPCDFEKTELFNPDGRANFRDRFGPRVLKAGTRPADKLRLYREVSPVNYLRKESPPLLMIQGDKDTTIPVHHAYYMQEKAKACAAPVELLIVKNAGHNWREVDAPIEPPRDEIVQRSVDFLVTELSRGRALQ
jgi:acetyl esterase/lipase